METCWQLGLVPALQTKRGEINKLLRAGRESREIVCLVLMRLALALTQWWVRLVLQPDLQRKLHLQLQPFLHNLPNLPKQAQGRPYLPGRLVYFRRY